MGWRAVRELWSRMGRDAPVDRLEREHQQRFLARLALSLIPAAVIVGMVVLPRWMGPMPAYRTAVFKAGALVAASGLFTLWLNRRGQVQWAARFFVGALLTGPLIAAFDRPEIGLFVFTSVLVATALLSTSSALVVGALGVLGQAALLLRPEVHLHEMVIPLCVNLVLLPLLLVVQGTYRQLDRSRLTEAHRSERWFATTLTSIGDGVLACDKAGRVSFMNPVAARLTGWSPEEARGVEIGKVFKVVHEKTGKPVEDPVRRVLRDGQSVALANHRILIARDGVRRPITDSGAPILDDAALLQGVVLVFHDMTEEKALEERLDHAQRFEALGRLAGGVAHDFNNLLTVIGGGLSLALDGTEHGSTARADLDDVVEATRRAVRLTRQLLAFSRRQVMQPRVVEINNAVIDAAKMIRRMLKENIELRMKLDDGAGRVLVDPVQLEQVLTNLAINGADAMPDGGLLFLETDHTSLGGGGATGAGAGGPYACVRVTDTGCGMDRATVARVFEPFFSTKAPGRGTGLGLAMVDGIVQQSGGMVLVDSQVGKGTTFTVLLPQTALPARITMEMQTLGTQAGVPSARPDASIVPQRPRTILIVEDDAAVCRLSAQILNAQGHRILVAASGEEALVLRDQNTGQIDLLITDIVLRGMSGPQIARAFRAHLPRLPVLFISGYADEVVAHDGMSPSDGSFLEKPFTPTSLLATVSSILDHVH